MIWIHWTDDNLRRYHLEVLHLKESKSSFASNTNLHADFFQRNQDLNSIDIYYWKTTYEVFHRISFSMLWFISKLKFLASSRNVGQDSSCTATQLRCSDRHSLALQSMLFKTYLWQWQEIHPTNIEIFRMPDYHHQLWHSRPAAVTVEHALAIVHDQHGQ